MERCVFLLHRSNEKSSRYRGLGSPDILLRAFLHFLSRRGTFRDQHADSGRLRCVATHGK